MNKKQAETYFKERIFPAIKEADKYVQRLEWTYYTDGLCKNGDITTLQYYEWMYPKYLKK